MATEGVPGVTLAGADPARPLDAVFVNAALRDYGLRPRVNDFTLPVLGLGYLATYATAQGFNIGVLDSEALGLSVQETVDAVNALHPRWAGFNLLAPTYELSATIAARLDPAIRVMVGGHQAKAMPTEILLDPRMQRVDALVLGEGELRVAALLEDAEARRRLPGVLWVDPSTGVLQQGHSATPAVYTAPDINALPFVDRTFLVDDPYITSDGRIEANMVGARGCPYNCSFCGAAVSANEDITIRTRQPANILAEMDQLADLYGVSAFRFVDDLFLGYARFITQCMAAFTEARVGTRYVWDATGRINILNRLSDAELVTLKVNGCREVALGIESGSDRLLGYMGKRITRDMTRDVVRHLTGLGISVKGYFILGFPTETRAELAETVSHVRDLWATTEGRAGSFRASVFEFRPYPGTPEWRRLMQTGEYTMDQLRAYSAVDLTDAGLREAMRERDEFNFSVNIQFGEATVDEVRAAMTELSVEQYDRRAVALQ